MTSDDSALERARQRKLENRKELIDLFIALLCSALAAGCAHLGQIGLAVGFGIQSILCVLLSINSKLRWLAFLAEKE